MNEIEKGLVIFLAVVFICSCAAFWYAIDRYIQLETQMKLLQIEMNFMTDSLQGEIELLEANLVRLKKGQW